MMLFKSITLLAAASYANATVRLPPAPTCHARAFHKPRAESRRQAVRFRPPLRPPTNRLDRPRPPLQNASSRRLQSGE
jgi:hypothetical protein